MIPQIDIKATGENIKALMKSTGVLDEESIVIETIRG